MTSWINQSTGTWYCSLSLIQSKSRTEDKHLLSNYKLEFRNHNNCCCLVHCQTYNGLSGLLYSVWSSKSKKRARTRVLGENHIKIRFKICCAMSWELFGFIFCRGCANARACGFSQHTVQSQDRIDKIRWQPQVVQTSLQLYWPIAVNTIHKIVERKGR